MMELHYRLSNLYWRWVTRLYFRPLFAGIGERTLIRKPLLIRNAKGIRIGNRCGIRDRARIELFVQDGVLAKLTIGDDVSIENDFHVGCVFGITIGDRVTISARCALLDFSHPYQDVKDASSLVGRLSEAPTPIHIGDGCFIGIGAVILPGVTLGERCVVGANAVVTRSMPAYTVCAGVPARVIRRYDPKTDTWLAV